MKWNKVADFYVTIMTFVEFIYFIISILSLHIFLHLKVDWEIMIHGIKFVYVR